MAPMSLLAFYLRDAEGNELASTPIMPGQIDLALNVVKSGIASRYEAVWSSGTHTDGDYPATLLESGDVVTMRNPTIPDVQTPAQ